MKPIVIAALLLVGSATPQDVQPGTKLEQHEWLQQLAGEWTCEARSPMAPGPEPMMTGTEKVRAVGDLWILCEGSSDFAGMPFTSLMTLGYDPEKKTFVGSWVDTMQTHLWTYVGSLDEAKKTLTLSAKGPSIMEPGKHVEYRDVIELKSPDHKVHTSSMQGDDGSWTVFMTAEYHRKKE